MNIKRFDVNYNQPFFKEFIKKLRTLKNITEIGTLVESWDRGDGPRTGFYTDDEINGVAFLRVNNLKEHSIDISDVKYINREVHEITLKRTQVTAGDVVFAVSGTKDNLGTVSVVPSDIKEANLNSALVRLNINEELINKTFFCYFFDLSISRTQIEYIGKGAAQNNLNGEEIGEILIPLPPLPIQEKLVEEMERARESRRRKLSEADALLSTLDGWLLDTLGITPPSEDNRKVFAVRLKAMNSERIDALYYLPTYIKAAEELKKLSHKVAPLRLQLEFAPLNGLDSRNYVETGQRYLRVQNVRPYQIDASDAKYVATNTTKDINLEVGDILLTRKGTYGVAAPVTQEYVNDLISSEVILLRLAEHADISTDYLVYWLNSSLAQLMFKRLKTGGVMGHVTQDVVNDFPVPIVDKNTQKIIVDKFNELRKESQRLKSEAESEWQAAKGWFEAQLLGE